MHTNACGFAISSSSLMYLAPSDFSGLEHLASSCRSDFDHSFSFSRRFIHGSGWWNGSGIRRRAVEASRTNLKSSRSVSIAPLATLRCACHYLLPPLHSFARGLRRSFNRSKSVGSHRSSSNTSASVVLSQLENLLFLIKPLPMRVRTLWICAVAAGVVYNQVSTPNFRLEIHRGICKLFTEMQRDTWVPEHRVSQLVLRRECIVCFRFSIVSRILRPGSDRANMFVASHNSRTFARLCGNAMCLPVFSR